MGCVFCEIIAGRGSAEILEASTTGLIFRPLNPVTPGHVLVVPHRHVEDAATNPRVTADTFRLAAHYVANHVEQFNLITSAGPAATQTVYHLHVHVVPRTEGDGLPLPWTPQQEGRR